MSNIKLFSSKELDHEFTVAVPYVAGHVVTDIEAEVLNSTFVENVRNNFTQQISRFKKEGTPVPAIDALQTMLNEYVESYCFGLKRTRGQTPASTNPTKIAEMNIAKEVIRKALKAKGRNLKEVGIEKIQELAKQLLASPRGDAIREEAARRIAQNAAIGSESLDSLDLAA